ncbi:MAG: hypothetical protein WCF18_07425 [Chthoniobacteraceae bacterium]
MKPLRYIVTIEPMDENTSSPLPPVKMASRAPETPTRETEEVKLVRKKNLAALLDVSPRTVDTWVSNGVIPYIAVNERMHLFDPVSVKKTLTTNFGFTPRSVR